MIHCFENDFAVKWRGDFESEFYIRTPRWTRWKYQELKLWKWPWIRKEAWGGRSRGWSKFSCFTILTVFGPIWPLQFLDVILSSRWSTCPLTSLSQLTTLGKGTRWKCSGRKILFMQSSWMHFFNPFFSIFHPFFDPGGSVLGDKFCLCKVPGWTWSAGCLCQRWTNQPDG